MFEAEYEIEKKYIHLKQLLEEYDPGLFLRVFNGANIIAGFSTMTA
ncbi:hypothetical protein ACXM0N_12760 [Peribacillus simplex]